MTILDALNLMAGGGAGLKDFLTMVGEKAPDLKPLADSWAEELSTAITPEGLVALATVIPGELLALGQGKVAPKDHPSDSI